MTTIRTVAEAKTLAMLLRQRKEEQKMKAAGKDPHNGFEPTIGAVRSVRWVEVPYFTNGIPCGGFEDCGEYDYERTYITDEEYDAGGRAVIKARGWSMIGAGIHHDDDLVVSVQPVADDGDIVVARSGNEQTIKVFYHDDNGTPWLVPQNPEPRYVPIPVDEETRIFGRVLAVHHNNPRCKTSLLMQKMMEMEARAAATAMVKEQVELPAALSTPNAQSLLKKAQAAGWLDEGLKPKCSRTMIALVAAEIAEKLMLNPKWKPFEELWCLDDISKIYSKAMEQKVSMTRMDEIRKALK